MYMEAYEKMLETWMELITTKKDHVPVDLLKTHAVGVFDSYVQCHISPPDGCRMQVCLPHVLSGLGHSDSKRSFGCFYRCM